MTHTEAREFANQFGTRMCDENGETHDVSFQGMTLRDYFAAKAMKEIMVQAYKLEQECFADDDFSFPDTMCSITKEAYKWADAMMKAREA